MEPKGPLFSPGGEARLPDSSQRCCFALVCKRTISLLISLNCVKCKPDAKHLSLSYPFWGADVRTRVEGGGLHCCVEQAFQLGGKEDMGVTCGTARLSRKPRGGGSDQPVGQPQESAGIRPELPFWKAEGAGGGTWERVNDVETAEWERQNLGEETPALFLHLKRMPAQQSRQENKILSI